VRVYVDVYGSGQIGARVCVCACIAHPPILQGKQWTSTLVHVGHDEEAVFFNSDHPESVSMHPLGAGEAEAMTRLYMRTVTK
jgi:hypothetical protein